MKRKINWYALATIFCVVAACLCIGYGGYSVSLALFFDAPETTFWRGALITAVGVWSYNRGMEIDRMAYRLALAEWELKRDMDEIKSHPDYRLKK